MSSRRILQNVLLQSMRLSAKRNLSTVPVLRASVVLNKGSFTTFNNTRRHFNSKTQESDIFKVVDFNDIQTIIKKDSKVGSDNCTEKGVFLTR